MADLLGLLTYVLSAMGLTILIVWPAVGPSAWVRDRIVRRLLWPQARGMLDCYVCFSPWAALMLAPLWWWQMGCWWLWSGPLMLPTLFWLMMNDARSGKN